MADKTDGVSIPPAEQTEDFSSADFAFEGTDPDAEHSVWQELNQRDSERSARRRATWLAFLLILAAVVWSKIKDMLY